MTDLETLDQTLAVFGSDVSRWPDGRAETLSDVMQSREGRQLIEEASALEQVLNDGVATPSSDTQINDLLLSRIMAATVDAPAASRRSVKPRRSGTAWFAGGAMAVALLIGVFAGVNGIGAVVTQDGVSFADGGTITDADDALLADLNLTIDLDFEDDV